MPTKNLDLINFDEVTAYAGSTAILSLTSDPSGSEQKLYFNTVSQRLRAYDGVEWLYVSPTFSKGGIITVYGAYRVHTFLTSGTLTLKTSLTNVDILVVGGGGAGVGGGGGGGQVRTHTGQSLAVGDHTISIGDGGTGANGDPSQFGSLGSAIGGGRGGGGNEKGQNGASGGGGGWACSGTAHIGGTGTAGNNGYRGDAACPAPHYLGAGGGAGDAGQGYGNSRGGNGVNNTYRNGGSGAYYGGGGGGGIYYVGYGASGQGGSGGGGAGGYNHPIAGGYGTPGTANTGGGGGSSQTQGGSGIVVVRTLPIWSGN